MIADDRLGVFIMELFVFVPIFIACVWAFIIAVFATTMAKTRRANRARQRETIYDDFRRSYGTDQKDSGENKTAYEPETSGFFSGNDPQHSREGVGNAPLHVVQPSFESGHYHAETSITGIQHDEPPREAVIRKKPDPKKKVAQQTHVPKEPEKKQEAPHRSRYRDAVVYGELLRPKYF